jgi:hypothetical protein
MLNHPEAPFCQKCGIQLPGVGQYHDESAKSSLSSQALLQWLSNLLQRVESNNGDASAAHAGTGA